MGDLWTFTAIDGDTKLVPCWLVGCRDTGPATEFMQDLEGRVSSRVQLTSDGHRMYLEAVEGSFGAGVGYAMFQGVGYAMFQKIYGAAPEGETRYSSAECIGARVETILGLRGPRPRLNELRAAPEPHDADEYEALHEPQGFI